MNRVRAAVVCAMALAPASPAAATATLACAIDDATTKLELLASVGTPASSPIGSVRGSVTLKPAPGRPSVKVDVTRENLAQQWIDGPALRLWLSVTGSDATPDVDLVIVARRVADTDFRGRYRLTGRRGPATRSAAGRVACTLG
jgi:hypothetical protein